MNRQIVPSFKSLGFVFIALVAFFFLGGCSSGGDDGDNNNDSSPDSVNELFSIGAVSDGRGRASASFNVQQGTTKLSVTGEANVRSLTIDEFSSSSGADYLSPGGETISLAGEAQPSPTAINAPSRKFDPTIKDGDRFLISAIVERGGRATSNVSVQFIVNTRADDDLENGTLQVNVFYVGVVGQGERTKDAVSSGIEEMRNIYGDAGISLHVSEFDIAGPSILPDPTTGADLYLTASAQAPSPAVNIFIGGDIEGSAGVDLLGISASIPGPPNPSARSAVAISILGGAGPDGDFSSEETRILGESMAHEAGHFMGLFHPVELDGLFVAAYDPLSDTPICSSTIDCFSNEDLTHNLMFFSPVDDGDGGYVPQNRLTPEQRGVLNRYIAVD